MIHTISIPHISDYELSAHSFHEKCYDLRDINSLIACYGSVSLSEIADAALMDRREEKFIITEEQAVDMLQTLSGDYRILEIRNNRLMGYETCYFDTDDYETYLQHHNGKLHRFKIRSRRYEATDESYFEIKHKSNTGRSLKKRIQTRWFATMIESSVQDFFREWYPYDSTGFKPQILNRYSRVTLVSGDHRERVTMDFSLSYEHKGRCISLPGIVIVEIKTPERGFHSPARLHLRMMRVRSTSFSKYCIGVSLLCPEVKNNRFKPKLHQIQKMVLTTSKVFA